MLRDRLLADVVVVGVEVGDLLAIGAVTVVVVVAVVVAVVEAAMVAIVWVAGSCSSIPSSLPLWPSSSQM